jgi:predicted small secreted protein
MKTTKTILAAILLATAALTGCANETTASGEDTGTGSQEVRQQLSDDAIQGKLKGILAGITFTSEGDYPYVVFSGDAVPANTRRISQRLVREKLGAAVKANSDEQRDIQNPACRAERVSVSSAIADGDAAEVPEPDAEDYIQAHHDKQLMIALKTMRSQLKGVVGFTFGTNEAGDQDELGTVHYVYVGISKSTGKLIAIMTQAVYT